SDVCSSDLKIRFGRIVEQKAVAAINWQGWRNWQWRKRTQRAGNNEIAQRRLHTTSGPRAGNQAEADHQQTIASQRLVHSGCGCGLVAFGDQQVGKVTTVLQPEIFLQ